MIKEYDASLSKTRLSGKRGIVHAQAPFYLIVLAAFFIFFLIVALFISPDQEEINQNFYSLRLDSITREFNSAFTDGSSNYDLISNVLYAEYSKYRNNPGSFDSDLFSVDNELYKIQSILKNYFDQFEYLEYDLVLEITGFEQIQLLCYQKGLETCSYLEAESLITKEYDHTTSISYYVPDGSILREININYNYIAR